MLTYINENFLHAPSTDLSREVVKFLINIILAQATEVFFEKCTDEKKSNALVSKIGSQAASMYTSLAEEVKEFMGKGIFDRNWVTIIQVCAYRATSISNSFPPDQGEVFLVPCPVLPRPRRQCGEQARGGPPALHPSGIAGQGGQPHRNELRLHVRR